MIPTSEIDAQGRYIRTDDFELVKIVLIRPPIPELQLQNLEILLESQGPKVSSRGCLRGFTGRLQGVTCQGGEDFVPPP